MFLRRLIKGLGGAPLPKPPCGKVGARAYAVGDIHGCLGLLNDLLKQIEADLAAKPIEAAFLVFVGDLIDRGPESAGVIERLRNYMHPRVRPIFLAGNHEEFFLRVLDGEAGVLDSWLRYGGKECVASYGLDADQLTAMVESEASALLRERIPEAHRRFLEGLVDTFRFGDYLFVHAGIRPGLELERQSRADLRWIRDPFLNDSADHGYVVVHGHTIVEKVEERPNRIGIDTGAYKTGVLTALVIEGEERRLLSASRPANSAEALATAVENLAVKADRRVATL